MYLCPFFVFKNLVIALFVLSVLSQSGFLAMHTVVKIKEHKRLVKKEMKRQLKAGKHNKDLVCFSSLQLKDASWVHSKEFFLGNGKYDVVRIEEKNGKTFFWCINDSKEQDLYKKLDKNQTDQNSFTDVFKKYNQICQVPLALSSLRRSQLDIPFSEWSNFYQYQLSLSLFRPPNTLAIV